MKIGILGTVAVEHFEGYRGKRLAKVNPSGR